jgi:glucose-6-phosphate isomerase
VLRLKLHSGFSVTMRERGARCKIGLVEIGAVSSSFLLILSYVRFALNYMSYSKQQLWQRFQQYYSEYPAIGLALDISRMNFKDDYFSSMEGPIQKAFAAMKALEAGAIANPDENRMVGHYWLRNPALAPTAELRKDIEETVAEIKQFALDIHAGRFRGASGPYRNLLLIGIGGSALGPQFVANALGRPGADKLTPYVFDNTDPDGMDRVLAKIGPELGQTLCVVVSKSGGTKETRNGMLEAEAVYDRIGLDFPSHAVAITSRGSELDKLAESKKWLRRFPMWDWVGGRTSELSAVGLLPAALQGFDIDKLLAGAAACDEMTRQPVAGKNPSALLALVWYYIGNGKGTKNMVVLPYKDRLELFSKYLQQLLMESLGKHLDLDGKVVDQGLMVLGNKGSTDQHSYIQQLRDGINNFFAVFIEVLKDRSDTGIEVEPSITSGDFLSGFFQGTRSALFENGRESVTITVREVSPFTVGVLIALFERAVGFYASLININAYHQPGVEAGKKAASAVIGIQNETVGHLRLNADSAWTADGIAKAIRAPDDVETVFKICEHLAANTGRGVVKQPGKTPFSAKYQFKSV